jgi:hypothetical protein
MVIISLLCSSPLSVFRHYIFLFSCFPNVSLPLNQIVYHILEYFNAFTCLFLSINTSLTVIKKNIYCIQSIAIERVLLLAFVAAIALASFSAKSAALSPKEMAKLQKKIEYFKD